ncbi:MAG: hypothetical protein KDN22_29355 [Verrucomicrobiae bacterium]|nr:hypothetical protein [Verrucomicrobiae bacterium]
MKGILLKIRALVAPVKLPDGDVMVGSRSKGKVHLAATFHHENEGRDTLFVMPRKNDQEGPVSMRITALRDLAGMQLSDDVVKDMLIAEGGDGTLESLGGRLITQVKSSTFEDPGGNKWALAQRTILADDIIFTMTVGTVEGREKEPQCKELEDEIPKIIEGLSRIRNS